MGDRCQEPLYSDSVLPGLMFGEGRLHRTGAMWDALADESEMFGRKQIELERTIMKLENPDAPATYTDVLNQYQSDRNKKAGIKAVNDFFQATVPDDIALGEKFTKPFDKRIRQLLPSIRDKKPNEQRKEWIKTIGKDAGLVKDDIIYAGINLKPKEFSEYLQDRYGLKPNQVDRAIQWLDWQQSGAHYNFKEETDGVGKLYSAGIANLSAANARLNPRYTIGNVMDLTRISSGAWQSGPSAPWKIIKAFAKTIKEGAVTPNQAIQSANIETSPDREFKQSRFDIFGATVNLQRNFAYNLDKEMGGDGFGLMSTHVFENAPWFTPPAYRKEGKLARQAFGLTRFMVAEAHYNYRTIANMLGANGADKIAPATAEFLTYQGIKAIMWGSKVFIPSVLLDFARATLGKEEVNKFIEETDKSAGINWGDGMTQAALDAAFGDNAPKANVSEFFTPALSATPILGFMYDKLNTAMDIGPELVKAVKADNPDQAAVRTLALGMSIANLLPYGGILNNTTFTSLVNGMAESMGDDANDKKTALNLSKAVLGARNVQKGDNN